VSTIESRFSLKRNLIPADPLKKVLPARRRSHSLFLKLLAKKKKIEVTPLEKDSIDISMEQETERVRWKIA